jgi:hypothetical protein
MYLLWEGYFMLDLGMGASKTPKFCKSSAEESVGGRRRKNRSRNHS